MTISKVPREHCTLTNNRLAAIQNEAIAAVQAATESVTGIKQINCTLSRKSNAHYQTNRMYIIKNQAAAKKLLPTPLATEMAIKGTGVNEAIAVVLKAAKAVAGIKDQLSKIQLIRKCHQYDKYAS